VQVLDELLGDVRARRSRALVVRGEPGIGKTALLSYAAGAAPDFQVARAEGVTSRAALRDALADTDGTATPSQSG